MVLGLLRSIVLLDNSRLPDWSGVIPRLIFVLESSKSQGSSFLRIGQCNNASTGEVVWHIVTSGGSLFTYWRWERCSIILRFGITS
ncbi:hypothetical protein HETIRDRAFT_439909 [Heterobasidion irregulare TC 32-1]|uniref:Uncharacterized protein n=1 Tax=Heterobasidion irregulare (strain TC 32-1) TaxID=747525 RepID=W4K6N9_HETIT|nr:uncharacterized protein HETIRDRAFT_439909 [Heterobasidion irregulare TC 32-1]ETW81468.1 hypothetical protein HETIRDRAFT_439909 [Heterobasidion irregulare TC 32-1]